MTTRTISPSPYVALHGVKPPRPRVEKNGKIYELAKVYFDGQKKKHFEFDFQPEKLQALVEECLKNAKESDLQDRITFCFRKTDKGYELSTIQGKPLETPVHSEALSLLIPPTTHGPKRKKQKTEETPLEAGQPLPPRIVKSNIEPISP